MNSSGSPNQHQIFPNLDFNFPFLDHSEIPQKIPSTTKRVLYTWAIYPFVSLDYTLYNVIRGNNKFEILGPISIT